MTLLTVTTNGKNSSIKSPNIIILNSSELICQLIRHNIKSPLLMMSLRSRKVYQLHLHTKFNKMFDLYQGRWIKTQERH